MSEHSGSGGGARGRTDDRDGEKGRRAQPHHHHGLPLCARNSPPIRGGRGLRVREWARELSENKRKQEKKPKKRGKGRPI